MTQPLKDRRIAVLGAGPIGLETAHALAAQGADVQVYEQGQVGASIQQWGHVSLFSPWSLNVSPLGLSALADLDVSTPDPSSFLTGRAYVAGYLEPLARHPRLSGRVHTDTKVVAVGRQGVLKGELIGSATRREHPFRLLLEDGAGQERVAFAEIVVDATGCWGNHNRMGDAGIPAPGERAAAARGQIQYTVPDVQGADAPTFAGKHTVVVGGGYSAITTLNGLLELQKTTDNTRITWINRGTGTPYNRIEDDSLPERDWLAILGNALAAGERGDVARCIQGLGVASLDEAADGTLTINLSDDSTRVEGVDQIVANVGLHPDPSIHRELQVHQCYASEGPMKLAAALLSASGGGGDCLAQVSMGAETLKSPEPDFFILGAKSYGRNSSYLIKLGLAQIEDLKTIL